MGRKISSAPFRICFVQIEQFYIAFSAKIPRRPDRFLRVGQGSDQGKMRRISASVSALTPEKSTCGR